VFTARYALSPYITQIRFVLKGLKEERDFTKQFLSSYVLEVYLFFDGLEVFYV
jgi:hypothetical protein